MNVASLELCKELYELSGWEVEKDDIHPWWIAYEDAPLVPTPIIFDNCCDRAHKEDEIICPAYDLGYLLRNLPKSIERDGRHYALHLQHDLSRTLWLITYGGTGKLRQNMSTGRAPEDAAAKLAIELFKQGRLKREES